MADHPITQVGIEAEINRLIARCERVTHEVAERARAAAEADSAYNLAFYTVFAETEGPEYRRKVAAKLATFDLYEQRAMTAAVLASAQEAGRNARAQLDSLRSLNANVRPQVMA